jgi:hypothetical protein
MSNANSGGAGDTLAAAVAILVGIPTPGHGASSERSSRAGPVARCAGPLVRAGQVEQVKPDEPANWALPLGRTNAVCTHKGMACCKKKRG